MTDWHPIADMPAELKDGREVLLFLGFMMVGMWSCNGQRVKNGWSEDNYGINPIFDVTHYAIINPPSQEETP